MYKREVASPGAACVRMRMRSLAHLHRVVAQVVDDDQLLLLCVCVHAA